MLTALLDDLAPRAGWVTFNGRAFDLPLLETRLTLNRRRGALGQRPHLDLLMPTRRLYRGRLASCSLGHVEQHVLNILRDQADVPGELIPQMYLDYLRTGDPSDMHRVIYHNVVDILSMVTLAAHLFNVFATDVQSEVQSLKSKVGPLDSPVTNSQSPATQLQSAASSLQSPPSPLQPEDLLRLAHWHADNGREAEAESAYRAALAGQLPLDSRRVGLTHFAALLKRQDRRAEAVALWEQLASFTLDDPDPFVELAKFYEWHAPNLSQAVAWAERALNLVSAWPRGWRRAEHARDLRHRLERLKAKMGREA
jgi:tetratricopeptide (TPR) repeat protein